MRLIDRDDLERAIDHRMDDYKVNELDWLNIRDVIRSRLIVNVKQAAYIVRCKDCWSWENDELGGHCADDLRMDDPEGFCSRERVRRRPVLGWIRNEKYTGEGSNTYKCPACGEIFELTEGTPEDNGYRFCPGCGTKLA